MSFIEICKKNNLHLPSFSCAHRYVSDHAFNGYKEYCQHKLLQCLNLEPALCRCYPTGMLEWKAIRKRACMAVEATFADGERMMGHVESFTTGEQFVSHLLQCKYVGIMS